MAYIGPPTQRPSVSRSRKCTASTLPSTSWPCHERRHPHPEHGSGPAEAMAVATPAMLRRRSSPRGRSSARRTDSLRRGRPRRRRAAPHEAQATADAPDGHAAEPQLQVEAVPRISTSIAGPQTNPFSVFIQLWKVCTCPLRWPLVVRSRDGACGALRYWMARASASAAISSFDSPAPRAPRACARPAVQVAAWVGRWPSSSTGSSGSRSACRPAASLRRGRRSRGGAGRRTSPPACRWARTAGRCAQLLDQRCLV